MCVCVCVWKAVDNISCTSTSQEGQRGPALHCMQDANVHVTGMLTCKPFPTNYGKFLIHQFELWQRMTDVPFLPNMN